MDVHRGASGRKGHPWWHVRPVHRPAAWHPKQQTAIGNSCFAIRRMKGPCVLSRYQWQTYR